jgi:UDP-glucose 4-epimerase
VITADINDFDGLLPSFPKEALVFHLAALADIVPSIERPGDYHRANVDGTFTIMELARATGARKVVYAASSSCYGLPSLVPTPEHAAPSPQYPYALTKFLGEQIVLHWCSTYKVPAISLRLFNVYGPRSRTSGTYGAVFGVFLAQKLANKPYTVVGDGTQTRDFVFVTDVARAFVTAAKSSVSGEIFNVGTGNPVSVNRITEILGGPVTYVPKRPGEPDVTHADVEKIHRLLDWKAEFSIELGVTTLLQQIDYWKAAPVWTPDTIAKATETWFQFLGNDPSESRSIATSDH